ncbi:MAG: hypothetical protein NT114_03815 [Patescibacteria group bacterium]|nr:hypothetical protein [Patescibacteria group bacterium]
MMELLFTKDTTESELQGLALEAMNLLAKGEAEMTSAKKEQATRLLLSGNLTHIRHGIAMVMAAYRHTESRRVWVELKELGFSFKSRKAVCDGLTSPVAGERQEAYSLYLDMRLEAHERADEVSTMLAEIGKFVEDANFWQTVRNPLKGKAERASELDFGTLEWVHRTLTGIEARFYGTGSGRKAKPAKKSDNSTVSFEEWRAAKAK